MLLWPPGGRRRARGRGHPARRRGLRGGRPRAVPRTRTPRVRRSTVSGGAFSAPSTVPPGRPRRPPRSLASRRARLAPVLARADARVSCARARLRRGRGGDGRSGSRAPLERRETRRSRRAPDLARLDAARDAVVRALVRRLPELPADTRADTLSDALEPRSASAPCPTSTRQIARYALRATGADDVTHTSAQAAPRRPSNSRSSTPMSAAVWFQNSVRGAAGLAVAVYIAQRTGLQHSFWVVLGRSRSCGRTRSAQGGRSSARWAGTAVGLVVGALLVIGIGTHEGALWGGAAAGRNLLRHTRRGRSRSPQGRRSSRSSSSFCSTSSSRSVWRVGIVRIEDIAIGFAISLGVGLLFWPRGAGALLRQDRERLCARRGLRRRDDPAADRRRRRGNGRAGRAADAAGHRLDDAFRQYLAELSATGLNVEDVGAFVGGARACAVRAVTRVARSHGRSELRLERCGENLDREIDALQSWYVSLGYALVNDRPVPPPHTATPTAAIVLVWRARRGPRPRQADRARRAAVARASQHIDNLWRLEAHLLAELHPTTAGAR